VYHPPALRHMAGGCLYKVTTRCPKRESSA
jgi:hypothetical protein